MSKALDVILVSTMKGFRHSGEPIIHLTVQTFSRAEVQPFDTP